VPGKGRSSADQGRLWQFRHEVTSLEDFVTLFEQAKDAMGLLSVGANAFTEDILRVEISGPTQPQLTIVDLPGLIHSHNKHQTEHDVELVTSLVAKYMANPRSIILAVVSAKNDFPNQIVRFFSPGIPYKQQFTLARSSNGLEKLTLKVCGHLALLRSQISSSAAVMARRFS
jgi:hypothetical protein